MSLSPLSPTLVPFLEPYLPRPLDRCFVTLTYAQSLDAKIAAAPGIQTKISHAETKAMTHYLRSKHDAILVGIGTVLADDPKLNCRHPGSSSPRPVVLDPRGQFQYSGSSMEKMVVVGAGLEPIVLVDESVDVASPIHVKLPLLRNRTDNWGLILARLYDLGIGSVMVEGGAVVINELLVSGYVDSVIVTVGPVYLGRNGVGVAPGEGVRMGEVKWWGGREDVVMAATTASNSEQQLATLAVASCCKSL